MRKILFAIQTLRPYHWSKNLFVFAALVFSKRLFEMHSFTLSLIGFALFSLASGAAYIFNDIKDIESDRQNPQKRLRPIAAGKISIPLAIGLFIILGTVSIIASYWIKPTFGLIILIYIVLNMLYSVILKHIVIVDVMVIAAGFLMRVMAGAELIDVYPSKWLILCTILLSLFLALGKRRNEIMIMGEQTNNHRQVLKHYNAYFLDQMIVVVMAATLMAYMLYTVSEETVNFFGNKYLVWTVPFVLYGLFRYFYLVHKKEKNSESVELPFMDMPLLINIILWLIISIIIIYTSASLGI